MNKKMLNILMPISIVLTGIILGLIGRPYNTALFSLHKIITVVYIIVTFITVRKNIKQNGASTGLYALISALAVSLLAIVATGALMSLDIGPYSLIKGIHAFTPIAAVAFMALTISALRKNTLSNKVTELRSEKA